MFKCAHAGPMFDLELCQFECTAVALLRQLRYIVLVKQTACLLRSLWWGGLELVLWCSLTHLELKNLAPESRILCQHSVIQCRSAHRGPEHAVLRVQKIAAAEPREQLAEIHLHSERTITVRRTAPSQSDAHEIGRGCAGTRPRRHAMSPGRNRWARSPVLPLCPDGSDSQG